MLILDENSDGMAILRTRPARPSWIAGGLFVALGVLPFLPAGMTLPRALTGLVLCAVGLVLIQLGRSKRTREALPSGRSGRSAAAAVVLTGSDDPEVYRAELLLKDGSRRVVLERPEPAGVVRDALRLARQLGVRVEPGWGLDHHALALLDGTSASAPQKLTRSVTSVTRPLRRQRIAAITTIWGGVFVLVVASVMSLSPYRPVHVPSPLSLLLPSLSVMAVLAIGLWLLGVRERLVLDPRGVTRERLFFGRPLGVPAHIPGDISGIFPVAPALGPTLHVIVIANAEPLSFHADESSGRDLAGRMPAFNAATGRAAE